MSAPIQTVSVTFTTPSTLPTSDTTIVQKASDDGNLKLFVSYNTTKSCFSVEIYGNTSSMGEYIVNSKLEQGSIATTFVPPDMATELLKCQRYYVRYYNNGNTFGNGFSSKDTIGFILIVLPAVMRKTPTCKLSGVYSISANHLAGSSKPVTFYGNLNFNMNSVKFEVQGSGFTANEPIMLQIRASDGYIEFDSEI